MKKFNHKVYHARNRVYVRVPGAQGISRLWVWDKMKTEYRAPIDGKLYRVRRYELDGAGGKVRVGRHFETFEEARTWQAHVTSRLASSVPSVTNREVAGQRGPLFRDIVEEWKSRKFPSLSQGTRVHYEQLVKLHMASLMDVPIGSITPRTVDEWLAERKREMGRTFQSYTRKSFSHELTLLTVILNYYAEYHDEDVAFRHPIKRRHRQDAVLKGNHESKRKDLSLSDFYVFRKALAAQPLGETMAAMATVQFFQALRISEAAAIHWEDVRLIGSNPQESRLTIVRHVVWSRRKGIASEIVPGFKNSTSRDGTKEQPLFPETFATLKAFSSMGTEGLVFPNPATGTFLTYRQIQAAYDRAFKVAKLPYSATHVMRHGGSSDLYNSTGDLSIAAQHLGTTMETAKVYAKRDQQALKRAVAKLWGSSSSHLALVANGRNAD